MAIRSIGSPLSLAHLSDTEVIAGTTTVLASERLCIAELLRYLAEIDARRLFLAEGYSSLKRYAIECLGMRDGQASHRTEGSRACWRSSR